MNRWQHWCFSLTLLGLSAAALSRDYTELSLEELGDVDVYSTNVLQAHVHRRNDLMFAYTLQHHEMAEMGDGDSDLSAAAVLANYRVTPLDMRMDMHMLHAMYAPSDELTLMLKIHYMEMEMRHLTRMGGQFTTQSAGFGDTEGSFNFIFDRGILGEGSYRWSAHGGVVLPTGDIDVRDQTPAGYSELPYAMQLGGGSYQLKLGLGLSYLLDRNSVGSFLRVQGALNENDAGYRPGAWLDWDLWYRHSLTNNINLDLGGRYRWQDSISGSDARLNRALVPTADADNYGGQRVDANLGFNFTLSERYHLTLNFSAPLWQQLNGPQLKQKTGIELNWEILL